MDKIIFLLCCFSKEIVSEDLNVPSKQYVFSFLQQPANN